MFGGFGSYTMRYFRIAIAIAILKFPALRGAAKPKAALQTTALLAAAGSI